jgi:hypothetical protein
VAEVTFVEHEMAVAWAAFREQHGDSSEWEPWEHEALQRLMDRVAVEAVAQERPEPAEEVDAR